MKRFQILILTIMLASLSACATNSLPSSSTESSVSISVSNPQDFLSELEDMETSQILEELKISDGGYTEDCFSVLSKRLVEFPEDTLCILNHNKLMADTDFEALVITGIGAELPYIGAAEEKDTLYKYVPTTIKSGRGTGIISCTPKPYVSNPPSRIIIPVTVIKINNFFFIINPPRK